MGEVFLKLLNMSITAGWLIVAILCVRLLFRKMPKWINCLLWGVVAIRLIIPFSIESALSLQPSAELIHVNTVEGGNTLPYVPAVDSNFDIVKNTFNPMLARTFSYSEEESVSPLQIVTEVSAIVWVAGIMVLLLIAFFSMINLSLKTRESLPCGDNVYICDGIKSPFIMGVIRPRIYLSSSLTEREIKYIVAHERAHLKRKDYLWKPLGYLLLCIYWFNPLCWIAYTMLCKDIELACDEMVISNIDFENKKEYTRVLLSCATQRRAVMSCPLAFGEVGVKERVKTVLNYKRPKFIVTALAVVVCAVIAVCFLTNPKEEYKASITAQAEGKEESSEVQSAEPLHESEVQTSDENMNAYEPIDTDFTSNEDFYVVATSMSSREVEQFAMDIRENVLKYDWKALSDKIAYPVSVNGQMINDSKEFLSLDFEGKISSEFVNSIRNENCREMFCNYQGISMGDMGQIWFSSVEEDGIWSLKIIGINAMLDISE